MDCGDFISYVYHTTLGLDMMIHSAEDPWHIKDMYADAKKGENSQFFEFIYKDVPISSIDEERLKKGDIILRMGSKENHGLIYVGKGMQAAHASRNGIKYAASPLILGFETVQFNRFYKTSVIVSIVRVKDGVVPENRVVNATIKWPDTGEYEDIIEREEIIDSKNINFSSLEMKLADIKLVPLDSLDFIENPQLENSDSTDEIIYWMSEEIKKLILRLNREKAETENE